jgi:hypothetical protein
MRHLVAFLAGISTSLAGYSVFTGEGLYVCIVTTIAATYLYDIFSGNIIYDKAK